MPQGRSGISSTTAANMVLDAGEVWLNIGIAALEGAGTDPWALATAVSGARKLGGTRGGNSFNPNRVIRQMPVDGAIGPVKGFNRRQSSAPVLTVNLLELTTDNLEDALAGANKATAGAFAKLTGGEIADGDYIGNVAFATTLKGKNNPIVIVVQNCLVLEAPEFSAVDEDETVLTVSFTGHVLATAPNTEVFAIYHPST